MELLVSWLDGQEAGPRTGDAERSSDGERRAR